jgi:hypothetical protein
MQKKLIINSRDLPLRLELCGENGEREEYLINPAGRKFGACLTKVPQMLRQMLRPSNPSTSKPKNRRTTYER